MALFSLYGVNMNFIKVCALAEEFEKQALEREIGKLAKKRKKKKGKQWKKMPKGWKSKSRKSYYESLVGKSEHPVSKCMEEMKGNIDDPGAFCASLKDRVEGKGWRKKKKKKKK